MKKILQNVFVAAALLCYLAAVISKLTHFGLYGISIRPISGLVFGNACLLLALILDKYMKD